MIYSRHKNADVYNTFSWKESWLKFHWNLYLKVKWWSVSICLDWQSHFLHPCWLIVMKFLRNITSYIYIYSGNDNDKVKLFKVLMALGYQEAQWRFYQDLFSEMFLWKNMVSDHTLLSISVWFTFAQSKQSSPEAIFTGWTPWTSMGKNTAPWITPKLTQVAG